MYTHENGKVLVVALGRLIRAVDALHANNDVVRELVRSGLNQPLVEALGKANAAMCEACFPVAAKRWAEQDRAI